MMLKATRIAPLRLASRQSPSFGVSSYAAFSSSTSRLHPIPNSPLNLDPSLQTLLNDVDISLKNVKKHVLLTHRELEVVPGSSTAITHELSMDEWSPMEMTDELDDLEHEHRKSPAALFGSSQIGSVILPLELQSAINLLIADGEKTTLRSDAKRLFTSPESDGSDEADWDTSYDQAYSSRQQASRHAVRDGTAFATVALPAHYSAISSVLHHAKLRLESSWEIDRIIDWGAATGSGLWASLYSFQGNEETSGRDVHDNIAISSKIKSYVGIDKRDGLVAIGKKLIANTPTGNLNMRWQRSFREENILLQEEAPKAIALSAFMLTTLPTSTAQKTIVREMWDSGAHTIVLIDHNTQEGFRAIAHARDYILQLGKAEFEDPEIASKETRGSHVLAPCPHDGSCPLLHSGGSPLICGFSQRIQRPSFVQRTKHSGVGHEDIQYSYVVIRRGSRPTPVNTSVGRIGSIGRRALEKEISKAPMKELEVHLENEIAPESSAPVDEVGVQPISDELTGSELQEQLRREAYHWPRLVFPPLKKSGHIILDSCTTEGKIMRLTIPKSQGKQPFYDARKSSWGDIFPHPPKNRPLERSQPKIKKKGESSTGADIGKRGDNLKNRERVTYSAVAESIRDKRKLSKRDYAKIRGEKVWQDSD